MHRDRVRKLIVITLAGLYVLTYVVLSRRGYAEADRTNAPGFYYVRPENSPRWRRTNAACVKIYWPINAVDRWFFNGRSPAAEPLLELSFTRT